MGAIAEAFVAYAQPLLDQTDGSEEQLNKAFAISQLCFNLALAPDDRRDATLGEIREGLKMGEEEFDEFKRSIITPMIQRHQEMFPQMHRRTPAAHGQGDPSPTAHPRKTVPGEAYPGTDRYAPCPCNSGEKYKFCCGRKKR